MMFTKIFSYWKIIIIAGVMLLNGGVWDAVVWEWPTKYFTIAVLNIGQGDSIYIESPTHNRMLVDGGPAGALTSQISAVTPFYNRLIDTLLITNPDADHFAGYIDLLNDSYSVNRVIEPGTHSPTATYAKFESMISEKNIPKIIARRGMTIHLGAGADITILYPDRDVSNFTTNDGSIVAKLTYGSTSVMLTGDAPYPVEEYVLAEDGTSTVESTILKVAHHGSRTGASEIFFAAVNPQSALISAGLNNSYGHPHKETLDALRSLRIPTLITFQEGTIIFRCTMSECTRH